MASLPATFETEEEQLKQIEALELENIAVGQRLQAAHLAAGECRAR